MTRAAPRPRSREYLPRLVCSRSTLRNTLVAISLSPALAALACSTPPAAAAPSAAPPAPARVTPAQPAAPAPSKLIKFDSDGVEISGVGFDAAHALYVAGEFSGKLQVGKRSLRSAAADPRSQLFLARIDPRGELDWLIRVGAPHPADLDRIAVAPDGSIALVGTYSWPKGTERGHTASYQLDAFVILVGTDGKVRWERRIDGPERQMADAVHRTPDGGVLVGGSFEDATRFGPHHRATSTPGPHVASLDFFLARYSPAGDVEWVATGGGSEDDRLEDVSTTPSGDILAVGDLGRNVTIGVGATAIRLPGAPASAPSANPGRPLVATYSPSGDVRWAVQLDATEWSHTSAARPLADGTLLVHGWEQGLSDPRVGFLAHLDARGKLLSRRAVPQLGGISADATHVVSARAAGSAIVFERQTGTTTQSEGPALAFSAPTAGLAVSALARGADGRVAVAGTTGEFTRTKISHDTWAVSSENIDGYVAFAPSISALRAR